jgi:hypothetical protein
MLLILSLEQGHKPTSPRVTALLDEQAAEWGVACGPLSLPFWYGLSATGEQGRNEKKAFNKRRK